VVFGELTKPSLKFLTDLTPREVLILAPLVVLTILFGVWPDPIFHVMSASIENLITQSVSTAGALDPAALDPAALAAR
jgi:NADH-quinone oxidoreductase subunit M